MSIRSALLVGLTLALPVSVSFAETTYSKSGTALTITVPEGETNEFVSTYYTADLTDIIKTGRGGLLMTTDLSAYEGPIHVNEGTYTFVDSKGLGKLGTCNQSSQTQANEYGQVTVADGATLECAAADKCSVAGKFIHFQGKGVNGIGALVWNSPTTSTSAFGINLFMDGDAFVHALKDCEVGFSGTYVHLDMGGHTLTMSHDCRNRIVYFTEVRIWNPGSLVQDGNTRLLIQNYNQLNSNGSIATHTINGGSHLDMYNRGGALSRPLIWNSNGTNDWTYLRMPPTYQSDEPRTYQGAVTLGRTMTTVGGMIFGNSVSGEGGITHIGAAAPVNFLKFSSANLTFSGPFTVFDTDVTFPEAGVFAFGDGVISSTDANALSGGMGTWNSFTKDGAGLLNYDSKLGSDSLNVRSGTIKLKYTKEELADVAGMVEGVCWYPNDADGLARLNLDAANCTAYRQRVTPGITAIYQSVPDIKKRPAWLTTDVCAGTARYLVTYSGYIWNHSDHPVTWSFGGCICSKALVGVENSDGEMVLELNAWDAVPFHHVNVTMKPGANKFWVACAHVQNDGGTPSKFKDFYIQYDPQGRNSDNPEDYQRIVNVSGQLPILTWRLPNEPVVYPRDDDKFYNGSLFERGDAKTYVCGPVAQFGQMSFAPATGIDFSGADYKVSRLSGIPQVSNCGAFGVSEDWTITTADLEVAQPMAFDELSFGVSSALTILPAADVKLRLKEWTLATSVKPIKGTLTLDATAVSSKDRWSLVVGEHDVKLHRMPPGLVIVIE